MKYILALSTLIGVAALEVCAQTSSSASQTVTFGVRRTAPVVLASAQASSVFVSEFGAERTSPLKMTVGSDSRSDFASNISTRSVNRFDSVGDPMITPLHESMEQFSSHHKASLPAEKSSSLNSSLSDRSVVTLTE